MSETLVNVSIGLNIVTLLTLLIVVFQAGKFVSSTEHGIKEAKEVGRTAHKRIDNILQEGRA